MNERFEKLEENSDVKFNDHKEVMKAFIQNVFAEFKEEMKKMFCFRDNFLNKKINFLESIKTLLYQQIISLKSAMGTSKSNIKELE